MFYRGVDASFATQRDVSRTKRDIKTFEVRLPRGQLGSAPRRRDDRHMSVLPDFVSCRPEGLRYEYGAQYHGPALRVWSAMSKGLPTSAERVSS